VIDYVVGIALLIAPNLFGFADGDPAAVWVPRVLGVLVLGQSVMTDYELGLIKAIPFPIHLGMDALVGLVLLVSPFALGFYNGPSNQWLPHVIVGIAELGVVLLTRPVAYEGRRTASA
jgi:hypothetical protein